MFLKKKNTPHKRRIETLTRQVKELTQINKLLAAENKVLKESAEKQQEGIDELMEQMAQVQEEYQAAIKMAKDVRSEYKKLIADVIAERNKLLNN